MNPQDEKRIEELFEIAVHLTLEERAGFFERHCPDRPDIRAELESLLQHDDEETKGLLVSPIKEEGDLQATRSWKATAGLRAAQRTETVGTLQSPERVGKYLIRQKIGEGGMGSVYLAEQRQPVRRDVAIKLIKRGMDSEEVLARFAREREALELMDHPGISRLLDGGTTEGGRPYFVMEYTPGLPIDRYCDDEQLGVAWRLELFCQVCDAVQYAHQKGVIHRDLKPGNVLVSTGEGKASVKVIDFGIAFASGSTESERDRPTELQQVLGTRHYMSPEQATPDGVDVDTRSDVYSLGVMLYDLLVGVLPFESPPTSSTAAVTPVAPSRRFSRLGNDSTPLAQTRDSSPRAHVRRLSGDLDWITIKAMEHDPGRRYASASELAADIRRHLAHKPVLAGPPELRYVFGKFLRRNRAIVVAGCLAILALIAGAAGLGWGLLEADQQRDEALESEKTAKRATAEAEEKRKEAEAAFDRAEKERIAKVEALTEAEQTSADAQAVTDFLVETVALADLEISMNPELSLEGMLSRAGERVGEAFERYPEREVAVRGALGRAFHSMGRLREAETHLQRTLDLETGQLSTPRIQVYTTMRRLSDVYAESDSREDTELRLRAFDLALDLLREEAPILGTLMGRLTEDVHFAEDFDVSKHVEKIREAAGAGLEPQSPLWLVMADSLESLGKELIGYDRADQSTVLYEEALRVRRDQMATSHPRIARTLASLVGALTKDGRPLRAEELVRESIEIYEQVLSDEHLHLAEARSLLGETLSYQRRGEEAALLLVDAHERILEARGLSSPAGVESAHRLVRHFTLYGDPDRADHYRAQLTEALAGSKNQPWRWGVDEEAFGPEHSRLLQEFHSLDRVVHGYGQEVGESWSVDLELYEATLASMLLEWEISTDIDSAISLIVARRLVEYPFFHDSVDGDLIRDLQYRMLDVLVPHSERFPVPIATCWIDLHDLAVFEGDDYEAEQCLRRAIDALGDVTGQSAENRYLIGRSVISYYAPRRRFEEAEAILLATWESFADRLGISHRSTLLATNNLCELYDEWGEPLRAGGLLRRHLSERVAADLDRDRLLELAWFILRTPGFEPDLYKLARSASSRARELAPEDEQGRSFVGMSLLRLGRLPEAERALEGCRQLIESNDQVHGAFRALLRIEQGRFEEAASLLANLGDPELVAAYEPRRVLLAASEPQRVLIEAHRRLNRGE